MHPDESSAPISPALVPLDDAELERTEGGMTATDDLWRWRLCEDDWLARQ